MTFQIHNRPAAKAVIALTIAAAAASCIKEVPADAIVAVGNALPYTLGSAESHTGRPVGYRQRHICRVLYQLMDLGYADNRNR